MAEPRDPPSPILSPLPTTHNCRERGFPGPVSRQALQADVNMSGAHERGRHGEAIAAQHLEERGWEILARNWRAGHREIDLVIRRENIVAFVEVKTRMGGRAGDPLEAVTRKKRREVEGAARRWILEQGEVHGRRVAGATPNQDRYRFDAVSVELRPGCAPRVRHLPDAWWIGDP